LPLMLSNGNALRPRGTISTQAEVLGRYAEIALSSVESVEAVTKDPQILRRVAQLPESTFPLREALVPRHLYHDNDHRRPGCAEVGY
jgi:hypothetical protein